MLFNSYPFIFCFFPITVATFLLLERESGQSRYVFLLIASLFFYSWWDVRFVPLLIASFVFNYFGACAIESTESRARWWTAFAVIACNLLLLGLFKYENFLIENANAILGTRIALRALILPLGISFFTFEQIGYVVEVYRGRTQPGRFLHYAIFVSFFPRLVAGPILRYGEIVPQIGNGRQARDRFGDLAAGLTIFSIGLTKKAFLADGIAPYATAVFDAAARGRHLDLFSAWGGVLAYSCQLYFDFSGYSDMAIGTARCFGFRLPANFSSPYKARNIIEFWRRWHITLSRFLRDYLYIPLGGNRRGSVRRYGNLMITMLLGGLWHGASWTFVAWGGLHGLYLMVNHGWSGIAKHNRPVQSFHDSVIGRYCGVILTFVAVAVAWTFFRARSFVSAFDLVRSMAGLHGVVIPMGLEFAVRPINGILKGLGVRFGQESGTQLIYTYMWVVALLVVVWGCPSTQELLQRCDPVLDMGQAEKLSRLRWSQSPLWAVTVGVVAFVGVISLSHVSEFIYWQF